MNFFLSYLLKNEQGKKFNNYPVNFADIPVALEQFDFTQEYPQGY